MDFKGPLALIGTGLAIFGAAWFVARAMERERLGSRRRLQGSGALEDRIAMHEDFLNMGADVWGGVRKFREAHPEQFARL